MFHEKYIKDGKVLAHLGFKSTIFPGTLPDLSAWVGFCTMVLHCISKLIFDTLLWA
jgi:hypothetical protein